MVIEKASSTASSSNPREKERCVEIEMEFSDKIIETFELDVNHIANSLNIKEYQARRKLTSYCEAIGDVVVDHYVRGHSLSGGITLSVDKMVEKTGRVKIDGKMVYAYPLLHSIYPLLSIIQKGSNLTSKLSVATVKDKNKWESLFKEIEQEGVRKSMETVKQLEDGQILLKTPVCVDALKKAFRLNKKRQRRIEKIEARYGGTKKEVYNNAPTEVRKDYFETIERVWTTAELSQASMILEMVKEHNEKYIYRDGFYMLPQVFQRGTNSPRLFGQGLNLQGVSKKIRYTALRYCHQYDLNSAAFALLYGAAKQIDDSLQCTYIEAYLENKEQVREDLTEYVYGKWTTNNYETIKRALTAIGFGAKVGSDEQDFNANYSLALANLFGDRVLKKSFLENAFVSKFIDEWKTVKTVITDSAREALKEGTLEMYPGCPFEYNNRIKNNKLLAYVFQCLERHALDFGVELAIKRGATVTLLLHDGFTTDVELDSVSLNVDAREYFDNPYLTFEYEKKHTTDVLPNDLNYLEEHRQTIAEEERLARNYSSARGNFKVVPTMEQVAREAFGEERAVIKPPTVTAFGTDYGDDGYGERHRPLTTEELEDLEDYGDNVISWKKGKWK